eukprot:TRINITY_DN63600_c0_g1_i2.p2 TRINITY_DN63600_c0_g1~~TRINITY_DN63600_c0_g1_i2.p2  ORF type:complete len:148 (-),score=30.87 TRINITY_DN63600_c0_g1_i2:105-548(-)
MCIRDRCEDVDKDAVPEMGNLAQGIPGPFGGSAPRSDGEPGALEEYLSAADNQDHDRGQALMPFARDLEVSEEMSQSVDFGVLWTDLDEVAIVGSGAEEYPSAADNSDPSARVLERVGTRDRSVLLWRQCGKKSVCLLYTSPSPRDS